MMMLLLPAVFPTLILFVVPELLTVPVLGLKPILKAIALETPTLETPHPQTL
jgi:hypothetical protein